MAPPSSSQPRHFNSLNDYIKHNYGSTNLDNSNGLRDITSKSSSDSVEFNITTLCRPANEDCDASEEESLMSGGEGNYWSLRQIALHLSLYLNLVITFAKLIAYVRTLSLSVLAALLDSVLDVVSQFVLNYTERHSSMQRSSAFYPAGASRLEPIGVLTCAALMGMSSFEVLKESFETLVWKQKTLENVTLQEEIGSFWSMISVIAIKILLYLLCEKANARNNYSYETGKRALQLADPTLEALAQDHWNDVLSNGVAAFALIAALYSPNFWLLDPIGAILISVYIIWSWYETGREQIEQLT
jgi:cation diffusion facilitator family transporter